MTKNCFFYVIDGTRNWLSISDLFKKIIKLKDVSALTIIEDVLNKVQKTSTSVLITSYE